MSSGGGRRQLEALSQQIEELEDAEQQLQQQIQSLEVEKSDIDDAIEGLHNIETGSTVQVPVGGDAHVRASIEDIEEVVVNIGADYAVEQPSEDAIVTLENRKEDIDARIEGIQSEIADLKSERTELQEQAQQSQQQILQQQAQQEQNDPLDL